MNWCVCLLSFGKFVMHAFSYATLLFSVDQVFIYLFNPFQAFFFSLNEFTNNCPFLDLTFGFIGQYLNKSLKNNKYFYSCNRWQICFMFFGYQLSNCLP